jgi:hypothetical protein
MSITRLVITNDLSAAGMKSVCDLAPDQLPALNNFIDYCGALAGGNQMALLEFDVGMVAASGTITVTSTGPANNETAGIAGYTLTAKTSGAVAANGEFNISATPATVATNIAAAINAVAGLSSLVSAAVTGVGIVTVTSRALGTPGNGIKFADVDLANVAFSGSGVLANGSEGTGYDLDLR